MTAPFLFVPTFSWPAAPGGLLYTYAAGTTTPLATYSDAAGSVPNANPVVLDASGAATVRVGSGAYKFVLKDSTGASTIWTQDNYLSSFLSASDIGALLYPQTAAETAVNATPVNSAYPPMHVDRYATNTVPGTTSMAAAFQAAINVARTAGGEIIFGDTGAYLIDAALNCTFATAANQYGFSFRGRSSLGVDIPTLMFKHTGHAFDCTGTNVISFYNFSVGTDVTTFPKTCFLLARNSTKSSQEGYRFEKVWVNGKFSNALYYNYGSEDETITNCFWKNFSGSAGAKCCVWTGANIMGLTSTFVTIATGSQSNIDHYVEGGQFNNTSSDAAADTFVFETSDSIKVIGPWMFCGANAANGRALFYCDTTNGPSSSITIDGVTGENATNMQSYGVLFGTTAATPTSWSINNCRFPNIVNAISAPAAVILDNFHIKNINEQASHGIAIAGTIQSSIIESAGMLLSIGTSKNNVLMGYSENWTVTTRTNDNWVDMGTSNKVWVPALGTVSHGGVLTINETRCLLHGNQVTVEFCMTDTVSITATAAQTITGLPAAARNRSAMVIVANETTGLAIGTGFIEAGQTAIKMPAFTVGAGVTVCVSATYFVA